MDHKKYIVEILNNFCYIYIIGGKYMYIKKFNEITEQELNMIIDLHYNHWSRFNPKMKREDTEYKFREVYTKDTLPFGVVLVNENEEIIGIIVVFF